MLGSLLGIPDIHWSYCFLSKAKHRTWQMSLLFFFLDNLQRKPAGLYQKTDSATKEVKIIQVENGFQREKLTEMLSRYTLLVTFFEDTQTQTWVSKSRGWIQLMWFCTKRKPKLQNHDINRCCQRWLVQKHLLMPKTPANLSQAQRMKKKQNPPKQHKYVHISAPLQSSQNKSLSEKTKRLSHRLIKSKWPLCKL